MRVTLLQVEGIKSKEQARDLAIQWQKQASRKSQSWVELLHFGNAFTKAARRFGLVREFKENGII